MIAAILIVLAPVVLALLYNVLSSLPAMPTGLISTYLDFFLPYLEAGMKLFNSFVYPPVSQSLLAITLVVEGIILGYKFVMWVVTKIPLFGVSD